MKKICLLIAFFILTFAGKAENGYDLWLRYHKIKDQNLLNNYRNSIQHVFLSDNSPTLQIIKTELVKAFKGLLEQETIFHSKILLQHNSFILAKHSSIAFLKVFSSSEIMSIQEEGFLLAQKIIAGKKILFLTAQTDRGLLYGCFYLLRLLQTQQPLEKVYHLSNPKLRIRMLNHWDNLNRTVERGYAGFSIFNWHTLPDFTDTRYIDYARANASIGINAISLTNVNANALVLTKPYLEKVKALADIFRPYGIKVFLTARFSAPIEIGNLTTADPLNPSVQKWWKDKAGEIYQMIPDFGGFLVKANSEGQPGPQNYQRNHADGANLLAKAVAPFRGIIIWRAFVYSNENPEDRHKQAYNEFVPLDGKFDTNVMVQVKNGAIDFMPREPFHPLFGAMPKTPLMMEFQLTQEYLGQATNLVFLAPLFKETLESDTYTNGPGSTVNKVIDGRLKPAELNGMAGVSNIGNDINWCGHPFAQANWYAFGRLAWDAALTSEAIATEWLKMTYTNDPGFIISAKKMMLESRDIYIQFTNPYGLHHIMGTGHHYGPAPWVNNLNRPEWNPVYYHKADSFGIGFNRTFSGSNALSQYHPAAAQKWQDPNTCAEKYLLWFHHVSWNYTMKNGKTLWENLCRSYYTGAENVAKMQVNWNKLEKYIDEERFSQVSQLLTIQHKEAIWWRNACLLYFQTFSKQEIPATFEKPDKTLSYYQNLQFPFAPGSAQ